MSDYYVKPMTFEEKVSFLDLMSESQDRVSTMGPGASLFDQDGTWLGGMCYLASQESANVFLHLEVGVAFIERVQGSGVWIRYWKDLSDELFKTSPIFKVTLRQDEIAAKENILEGLGPWDRQDIGDGRERFLFEKNYTSGFITGENVIPKVKTTVTQTSTGTFITKILPVILD